MTAARPEALAFDVVETLFSLDAVAARLAEIGAPESAPKLWFARLLRDGFALAASRDYRPFRAVAASSLRAVVPDADDGAVENILAGLGELEAHPDAEPALARAAEAGVPVLTLTNGSAESTRALLDRAGLARYVARTLSVDEVKVWKPAAAAYRWAATELAVPPGRLALVAVHSWDVHGARRAGLVTGWCSRLEGRFPEAFAPADVEGADLVSVVKGLLALDGSS